MRKFGIAISGVVALLGLIGVILFLVSLPGIFRGDTDGLAYLFVLPALLYSIILFTKLIKDEGFYGTHKLTVHLLVWPVLLSVAVSIFYSIAALATGEGLGFAAAIFALIFGIFFASVLSFIGFLIDFFRNK
jgi:hypothetical protein